MLFLNPKNFQKQVADEKTEEIFAKTITFFEEKGLKKIKDDDQESKWYNDFIHFLEKEEVFSTLLTPTSYSEKDARFDLSRVCDYSELTAYYSLAYQYCY